MSDSGGLVVAVVLGIAAVGFFWWYHAGSNPEVGKAVGGAKHWLMTALKLILAALAIGCSAWCLRRRLVRVLRAAAARLRAFGAKRLTLAAVAAVCLALILANVSAAGRLWEKDLVELPQTIRVSRAIEALAGATHKQSDLRGILGGVLASSSDWDPYDSRQPRFGASPEDPNHLVWVYYRLTVGPYPESTCSGRGIGHCIRLAVALGIPTDQIVKALPRVRDDVVGTAMDPQGKGCRRALIAVAEGTARSRKARKAARAEFADLLRQRWQTQVEATTNGITSAVVDHERNTYERYVQAVAQRQAERARVAERSQAQREAARRRETDTEEDDRAFVSLYEATYGSCTAEVAAQRVRVTAE